MAAPVIEFRDPNNPGNTISTITLTGSGINNSVVSGSASNVSSIRIYNNYVGASGIPDALNCVLAAYDDPFTAGNATTDPVKQTWLQVAVLNYCGNTTNADASYIAIGGSTKHPVPTNSATVSALVTANPSAAPTGTNSPAGTSLGAGSHYLGYTYITAAGETTISPLATFTLSSGDQLAVNATTLPTGVTSANYYFSVAAGSTTVRKVFNTTGSGFTITSYPSGTAALPPTSSTANLYYITVSMRVVPPAGAALASVLQGLWLEYAYI